MKVKIILLVFIATSLFAQVEKTGVNLNKVERWELLDSVQNTKDWVKSRSAVNVKDYGVVGDGVTDDTQKIQDAIDSLTNGELLIPKGNYLISSVLTVSDNITIYGYGARIFNTSTQQTLLSVGDNVNIYGLELEGVGNSSTSSGIGISAIGADASNYIEKGLIEDCYIHGFGAYGIYHKFAKDINVNKTKIYECGIAGYMGLSVSNINIDACHIKDISPGSGTDAWGVSFTRQANTSDTTTYPFSSDCSVVNSKIEDVTIWQGMGTHAGKNISFKNNTIRGCAQGISLAGTTGDAAVAFSAPHGCSAIGNKIYGIGTGAGIILAGISTEHSYGNAISQNELFACGLIGNTLTAGIIVSYTSGTVISNNINYNPYAHGINIYTKNYGFSCIGNTCIDPQSATLSSTSGIALRDGYNVGIIQGNSTKVINTGLNTYVGAMGIKCSSTTGSELVIGNNYSDCTFDHYGLSGQNVTFGTYSDKDAKIWANNGTPEGVITAPIGSMCINTAGGSGTTLYIKESGSGNTGWVGK